ncbi:hypothetical protein CW368_01245 [Actinomycetales bacterium SN12]|nr:hypothetical protein CW368_01245 [Actinomycetales bacterium SN12]
MTRSDETGDGTQFTAASKAPATSDTFSSSTPYGICEYFAAGSISREQLIDELVRFPYVPGGTTDGYDSLLVDPSGTWSEVADAARRGVIDDAVYAEVFRRRHPEYAAAIAAE